MKNVVEFPMIDDIEEYNAENGDMFIELVACEDMEGLLRVSDDFEELSSLEQADLLSDWIHDLKEKYAEVTGEGFLEDLR